MNTLQHSTDTIGVLGGLGPDTTAHFYLDLIKAGTRKARPPVCIWSLPLDLKKEAEYIQTGKHQGHYLQLLREGAQALQRAGSKKIVIPCNTVHEFHAQLSQETSVSITHLPTIVAEEAKRRGWKKVFLLATSRTIHTRIHEEALGAAGIDIAIPEKRDQAKLDILIQGILGNQTSQEHQQFLERIIQESDVGNIILGCTDLQLLFPPSDSVIDSMQELVRHTAQHITS